MQLIQCVSAYIALLALSEKEFNYQTAHALVTLKRRLKPHVEFYAIEEKKLVEEYAEKDVSGNIVFTPRGTFKFQDDTKAGEYATRRAELGAVAVQEDFAPASVVAPASISPTHLEALEGFLAFEEGAGK